MSTLKDSDREVDRELGGFRNFTAAALAINAAAAATFKTTSAYVYTNDGVFRAKTALAAQAFTAGHATVQIGSVAYFVVGLDWAGAVSTTQGIGAIPDVPNGITPVGIIKVAANTAAFVPGTSALDLAGTVATYFDIAVLPAATTL